MAFSLVKKKNFRFFIILGFLFVQGCTIRLAPEFDQQLVNSISKINEDLMILFSSISGGAPLAKYDQRQGQYDVFIGKFDAMIGQIDSRPVPQPPTFFGLFKSKEIEDDPDDISILAAPTGSFIETMKGTVVTMKQTEINRCSEEVDSKTNPCLSAAEVAIFKGQITISMDQALTYEKALNR